MRRTKIRIEVPQIVLEAIVSDETPNERQTRAMKCEITAFPR
jgi:hypothetical protein